MQFSFSRRVIEEHLSASVAVYLPRDARIQLLMDTSVLHVDTIETAGATHLRDLFSRFSLAAVVLRSDGINGGRN